MTAAITLRTDILLRVLAGLVGSWGFVWGFSVLGIAALFAAGMEYWEAYRLVMMLAFVLYLVLFCWSFAAANLKRVWAVLAIGGFAMTLAGWLIARQFPA